MNHWRNRVFYKLGLMFDPIIMVNNSRNSKCISRGYHEWVWDEIRCDLPRNIKCRQCSSVAIFHFADWDKVDEFFKKYFGC
jgi:hypothetical protein